VPGAPSLPGYEVLDTLGRGGMGVVYKARQVGLDRVVALKMILAGSYAGPELLDRFRAEAQAVARLRHPGIVQVYEVSEADGLPFFSLEFVEGGSLRDRLAGEPQPPAAAATLAEKLARAVQAAHEAGVVHRDLKPANVLLTADGTPKITDFGLAKNTEADSGRTHTGQVMGTPSYMAPEQAAGQTRDVGPRTDVYALGAVLYETLTGRPPFRGTSVRETLEQVCNQEPVPPSRLQPGCPRDLETVCLKCLQKEPSRRYESAAALADDLTRFLKGEPVRARPVGRAERLGRCWCRRNPVLATVTGLAALLAVGLITTLAVGNDQLRRANLEKDGVNQSLLQANHDKDAINQDLTQANGEKEAANRGLVNALAELGKKSDELGREKAALEEANKAKLKALREDAALAMGQGLNLCDEGNTGRGLLWLARGLRTAGQAEADDVGWAARMNLAGWGRHVHPLRAMVGHHDSVMRVAFSPDGKLFATASSDGTARLWDAATATPVGAVMAHENSLHALAFRPDGKAVATGSYDGAVRTWDVPTGQAHAARMFHRYAINDLAYSPDGSLLASAGQDGKVRLWNADTGRLVGLPLEHKGMVERLAFSPDGKLLVTGSSWLREGNRGYVGEGRLWDVEQQEQKGATDVHDDHVRAVAFSPDGKFVVVGGMDGVVTVLDPATGKPAGEKLKHPEAVEEVAFNPDGKVLATGAADGVRLWLAGAEKATQLAPLLRHPGWVRHLAFSPDGRVLASAGKDHSVRLWSTPPGSALGAPLEHDSAVHAVAFSPDSKTLLTGAQDDLARLWTVSPVLPEPLVLAHGARLFNMAMSPDGKTLVTAGEDGRAGLWAVDGGKPVGPPLAHRGVVYALAFSPDGKTVLTGDGAGTVQAWDAATGKAVGEPVKHAKGIFAVAFSPDGKRFATACYDDFARLWDAATREPVGKPMPLPNKTEPGINTVVSADNVAFSPDGTRVVTGSRDGVVQQWDAATGEPVGPPMLNRGTPAAVKYLPDGKTLVVADHGGASLWDAETGEWRGDKMPHRSVLWCLAVSHDGRLLATGSEDRTARTWDAATGKPVSPPLNAGTQVHSVAFSPDDRLVAVGSLDGSVRLWEARTGRPLGPPWKIGSIVQRLAFTPDGKRLASCSYDGWGFVWPVPEPQAGDADALTLTLQDRTGLELRPDGTVGVLGLDSWPEQHRRAAEAPGNP
jgi:WD40 repeat protein/tRNA A-37 threonylcarbamoyl transferase component Bud32